MNVKSKAACFGDGHWTTMVGLVKNRRALAEYLNSPTVAEELKDIDEKYAAEVKEKKKSMKLAAGEQLQEEESQLVVAVDDEDHPEPVLQHMLVGEDTNLPIKTKDLKGEKLEKAGWFQNSCWT